MGTNILLSLIVGVAMTAIVGSQIGPNYIEQIKIKKVQTKTINNQDIIFEGIKRYVTIKQVEPNSLQDVINAGYLDPNVNDNGFNGGYTIDVDKAKGVATITTTITDKSVHEAFLNSFTNMSKPSCTGVISNKVCSTNTFKTTFVIPNEVMHGNALLMTGVPIQSTPPDSSIYKYWYDTSGTKVVLKIYDGASWKEINLGGEANTENFKPGNYDLITPLSTNISSTNNTKYLEFIVSRGGTLTISFTLTKSSGIGYARIYKNNLAIGINRSINKGTSTFTENINVNAGDKLQLYGYVEAFGSAFYVAVSNFRIMSSATTMNPIIKLF
ncbi:hypothetical protein [Aliarcobacter butzleri]|uniref:hypothetical protein n=1 Tax=Aliarcobacter butzleri TaxID=28197 RepID=UPI0021B47D10|nr:hypothetical protein [Aliarcobacter butzleri]MCT7646683.1 hypothetical protein [Aliarcobacter butzleri]